MASPRAPLRRSRSLYVRSCVFSLCITHSGKVSSLTEQGQRWDRKPFLQWTTAWWRHATCLYVMTSRVAFPARHVVGLHCKSQISNDITYSWKRKKEVKKQQNSACVCAQTVFIWEFNEGLQLKENYIRVLFYNIWSKKQTNKITFSETCIIL